MWSGKRSSRSMRLSIFLIWVWFHNLGKVIDNEANLAFNSHTIFSYFNHSQLSRRFTKTNEIPVCGMGFFTSKLHAQINEIVYISKSEHSALTHQRSSTSLPLSLVFCLFIFIWSSWSWWYCTYFLSYFFSFYYPRLPINIGGASAAAIFCITSALSHPMNAKWTVSFVAKLSRETRILVTKSTSFSSEPLWAPALVKKLMAHELSSMAEKTVHVWWMGSKKWKSSSTKPLIISSKSLAFPH